MGRKNRKKKHRNNGSSTGSNIKNNTVPDVATTATATTTTIMRFSATQLGFTKNQMKKINKKCGLKGYPKSMHFADGYKHYMKHEDDEAIASFIRGAKNDGCVGCMFLYGVLQRQRGNEHLALPFYFESALRGHVESMQDMIACYNATKPLIAHAFQNFWMKIMIESGDTFYTNEERLVWKKKDQSKCAICGEEDSEDTGITLKKCGGCRYYFYCGTDCQLEDWYIGEGGGNHIGECRQLKILKHHYRRYVEEIREAIIRGEDPRTNDRLQRLRILLGLSRPTEEYEDLLLRFGDDDKNGTSQSLNRYEYLTARKDGTVWIGSTPNMI